MLKTINPILSPEILYILRAMGHRQDLAIVDANFPCENSGPRIARLDGISATDVLDAVLSIFPIERKEPEVAWRMIAGGNITNDQPIFGEFKKILRNWEDDKIQLSAIDPNDFKARVRSAYAVIVTGERRLYANIIVRKGVVPPG
jgi:L-fucose mutarotase